MMAKILISACLIGEKVRYDGKDNIQMHARLQKYLKEKKCIAICPEMAGGLLTPRPPAQIQSHHTAEDVLRFSAKVLTNTGQDVSNEYRKGAQKALELAQKHAIRCAILKSRSPSCGSRQIYDGTFSKQLIEGMGVTAQLLSQHGIKVFDETEIDEALNYAESLSLFSAKAWKIRKPFF